MINYEVPTLFHGTDLRFVSLSEEHRKMYNDICHLFINILYSVYQPFFKSKERFLREDIRNANPELAKNIDEAIANLSLMTMSEEWQYGDFYLTSKKMNAKLYALQAFAGGEIGFTAYHLIKGVITVR